MTVEEATFPFASDAHIDWPPPGRYDMWWPGPPDPSFATSPTRTAIRDTYRALAGIESDFLACLLPGIDQQAGLRGLFALRVTPQKEAPYVISASSEKGVRIHFDREATSIERRNQTWRHFADFASQYRSRRERSLIFRVTARFRNSEPFSWWQATEQVALMLESSPEPPQAIGTLLLEPPRA